MGDGKVGGDGGGGERERREEGSGNEEGKERDFESSNRLKGFFGVGCGNRLCRFLRDDHRALLDIGTTHHLLPSLNTSIPFDPTPSTRPFLPPHSAYSHPPPPRLPCRSSHMAFIALQKSITKAHLHFPHHRPTPCIEKSTRTGTHCPFFFLPRETKFAPFLSRGQLLNHGRSGDQDHSCEQQSTTSVSQLHSP